MSFKVFSKDEARYFVESLKTISDNLIVHAEISGAHHAFDVFPSIKHVLNGVVRFADCLYSDYLNKAKT